MDLFDYMRQEEQKKESPLASRIRPKTLDEFVGQEHIIGPGKLLYRAIKADKLSSVIFYGPPGTGKTTLAMVIANTTSSLFEEINASTSGKKDMEAVVMRAKDNLGMHGKKTILFIDEIHRFNKAQQDFLLPHVENGTVILIGATTENPYFEVNSALVSRSTVFELRPLSDDNIKVLIKRAVYDEERGMGSYGGEITDEAVDFLANAADSRILPLSEIIIAPEIIIGYGKGVRVIRYNEVYKIRITRRILNFKESGGKSRYGVIVYTKENYNINLAELVCKKEEISKEIACLEIELESAKEYLASSEQYEYVYGEN